MADKDKVFVIGIVGKGNTSLLLKEEITRALKENKVLVDKKAMDKHAKQIINEMNDSIFNEDGTLEIIIGNALKEIENVDNTSFNDYELKAYTMNIIKQCMNFIGNYKGSETNG